MNLNPFKFFSRAKADSAAGLSAVVRAGEAMGPWQSTLGGYVPREVNPYLYEALREAVGILDGAVVALVALDGILRVEGDNDRIVNLLQTELFTNIQVNDAEAGMQAFYASLGNELYEQGMSVGEMVMDARGRELIGLRVADSKGIAFSRAEDRSLRWWYRAPRASVTTRRDGTDQVEAVIRNVSAARVGELLASSDYVELDSRRMVYSALMPEADSPYGVSVFRSLEFVSQILLKIENATGRVWERFGDPPYSLTFKVKNRALANDQSALEKRRLTLANNLAAVLEAKRKGNSADFVNAIGGDDVLELTVIGGKDQVLEIEKPARHLVEMLLAKIQLPSWMLGLQWSTAERLADVQAEMALQGSRVRFERRLAGLNRVVETWLRGRGETWKPGDWKLVQELPNLRDELKRAQARFLEAQTDLMRAGVTGAGQASTRPTPSATGTEDDDDPEPGQRGARVSADGKVIWGLPWAPQKGAKRSDGGEPWAESDPALPRIESARTRELLTAWRELGEGTLKLLGLGGKSARKTLQPFLFSPELKPLLESLVREWTAQHGAESGALVQSMLEAWERGVANAMASVPADAAAQAIALSRATVQAQFAARGMELVTSTTARAFSRDVLDDLSAGIYNGESVDTVTARLRARFEAHDYDWERLVRSEMAQAQSLGKIDEYRELGVTQYNYLTAEDSRVSAICRANAAGGPYEIGKGPMPMTDSHPNCRCSVGAVIE